MSKNWKRWLASFALAACVMAADFLSLFAAGQLYKPNHPPAWLVAVIFWFLAWPVSLTRHVLPNGAGAKGPTFLAVAAGGLIDLLLFTLLLYALLSWRAGGRRHA